MTQKTAAFKSGWDSFIQGVVVGDNPFDEKNDLHWEWMRGWTSSATEKKRSSNRMSFKDKYSFWIDRKVDGFVYRFSEFAIKRHAIGAPEHWEKYLEFDNPRETAREWRNICDEAIKEQSKKEALEIMAAIERDNGMTARNQEKTHADV